MRQNNACVSFLACLLVVLVAHVHGAYEIVDTVQCANVLDSLRLEENLIDIKIRGVVTYDLSSMDSADTSLFIIKQPTVSFSASNNDMRTDETTDKFASKLIEKYRLAYTTSSPPKSAIGAMVFTHVEFKQTTSYENSALKLAITQASRTQTWRLFWWKRRPGALLSVWTSVPGIPACSIQRRYWRVGYFFNSTHVCMFRFNNKAFPSHMASGSWTYYRSCRAWGTCFSI